ncbi:MAG TPA: hypothetical protein PKD72_11420, partial [Gemmatales bacterium]|nr:hypothetical protein [Gemmatales bacterium]
EQAMAAQSGFITLLGSSPSLTSCRRSADSTKTVLIIRLMPSKIETKEIANQMLTNLEHYHILKTQYLLTNKQPVF